MRCTRRPLSAFSALESAAWSAGAVSDVYQRGFGPLTALTAPALLRAASYDPRTDDLLDAATGPGQVMSAALDAGAGEKRVIGIDFSRAMLDLSAERLATHRTSLKGVPWREGNLEDLSSVVKNESFDVVVCAFGVLHLGDPDAFLKEAVRCLRPGGRLAFSVWAAPPATEGFEITLNAIDECGDSSVVEQLPPGPPFFRFADAEECLRSCVAAGFEANEVKTITHPQTWRLPSLDTLFETMRDGTARTRATLELQSDAQLEEIQAQMREACAARGGWDASGVVELEMPAVITVARKMHSY